jgi:ribosomal-protein-alanine N-acetyltransferase
MIFQRYSNDPLVTRYLGWPRHEAVAEAEAFVAFSDEEWTRGGCGPYLVWRRDSGDVVGGTGLHRRGNAVAETGYVFSRDAWGRGYATEALRMMLVVAAQVGIERIVATCHADHRASAHVLEKCGFTFDRRVADQVFPNLSDAPAPAHQYVYVTSVK